MRKKPVILLLAALATVIAVLFSCGCKEEKTFNLTLPSEESQIGYSVYFSGAYNESGTPDTYIVSAGEECSVTVNVEEGYDDSQMVIKDNGAAIQAHANVGYYTYCCILRDCFLHFFRRLHG